METRTDNEARLGVWPELTPENVGAWIMANCVTPWDCMCILTHMIETGKQQAAQSMMGRPYNHHDFPGLFLNVLI